MSFMYPRELTRDTAIKNSHTALQDCFIIFLLEQEDDTCVAMIITLAFDETLKKNVLCTMTPTHEDFDRKQALSRWM